MTEKFFFTGPVNACDAYGGLLADEPGFGDVALHRAHGPRGLLCPPRCAADGVKGVSSTCGAGCGIQSRLA